MVPWRASVNFKLWSLAPRGPTSLWLCHLGRRSSEPQNAKVLFCSVIGPFGRNDRHQDPNTSNVCASAAFEVSCPAMVKHPLGAVSTAKCCRCATPSLSAAVKLFSACAPSRNSFGAETQGQDGLRPQGLNSGSTRLKPGRKQTFLNSQLYVDRV